MINLNYFEENSEEKNSYDLIDLVYQNNIDIIMKLLNNDKNLELTSLKDKKHYNSILFK